MSHPARGPIEMGIDSKTSGSPRRHDNVQFIHKSQGGAAVSHPAEKGVVGEHDFEPVPGLPEVLPAGEQILWQGAPQWTALARRVFHARTLSIYFAVLLLWSAASVLYDGGSTGQAVMSALWLLPLAALAVGLLTLIAWLTSRAALYTITNKRIVMRIGVVLTVTFNIPFRSIESAGLRTYADGTGDIPLSLDATSKIAYVHLWPHARPWHLARPEPMLRSIADAQEVARMLTSALAATAEARNSQPYAEPAADRNEHAAPALASAAH